MNLALHLERSRLATLGCLLVFVTACGRINFGVSSLDASRNQDSAHTDSTDGASVSGSMDARADVRLAEASIPDSGTFDVRVETDTRDLDAQNRDVANDDTSTDAPRDATDLDVSNDARPPDAPAPDAPVLPAPSILHPPIGTATGSAHAPVVATRDPRGPSLTCAPVPGASSYEWEIDDSCDGSSSRSSEGCTFPSPEAAQIATSSYAVARLPVSLTTPVGRRYYWRVRACSAGGGCGAWSRTMYFDAGRQRCDFNGDGYADLAVSAPRLATPAVYVFNGGTGGVASTESYRLDNPSGAQPTNFGERSMSCADVNADGFGDLLIGAPDWAVGVPSNVFGGAFLYLGSAVGLRPTPTQFDGTQASGNFGEAVHARADFDADGYSDIAIGSPEGGGERGYVFLAFGPDFARRQTLLAPIPRDSMFFGSAVAFADVDGNGVSDLLVGARGDDTDGGGVYIYRFATDLTEQVSIGTIGSPGIEFGFSVIGTRLAGDSIEDLIVGAPGDSEAFPRQGMVYAFSGIALSTPMFAGTHPARAPGANDEHGYALANVGIYDGDAIADWVVGAPRKGAGGYVAVFQGDLLVSLDAPAPNMRFGEGVGGIGDANGDGFDEVAIGSPGETVTDTEQGAAFVSFGGASANFATAARSRHLMSVPLGFGSFGFVVGQGL